MQKYVAINAMNVTHAGNHHTVYRSESLLRKANSATTQIPASAIKIQTNGKAYGPPVRKISIAMAIRTTDPSATVAGIGDPGVTRSTCAAQIARTKWKNGSQRKLQRNTPAAGIMQTKST